MNRTFPYNPRIPAAHSSRQVQRYFSGMSDRISIQRFFICSLLLIALSGCDDLLEKDISESAIDLITPVSGWKTENYQVNFSWSALEGASDYYFELASPSFGNMQERICDSVLTETKLSLILSEGFYEWRVRGQNSGYASIYRQANFEIVPAFDITQQTVTLTEPGHSQVLGQSFVSFKWEQVEGAHYYQIKIKKNNWSGDSIASGQVTKTSFSIDLDDGKYIWGVAAVDTVHKKRTDYSLRNFSIDKNAPASPMPVHPAQNDTINAKLVRLSWTRPEEDLTYTYEVYSDAGLTTLSISNQVTDTTAMVSVTDEGRYFWRVKATDKNNNTGSFSTVSSFVVKLIPDISQSVVKLRSPNTSTPLTGNVVTFWWEEVTGAEKYLLQVVSPGFDQTGNLLVNEWTEETTRAVELPAGTYQWRVKAANSQYSTSYSTGNFSIYKSDIALQLVELISPPDGSLLTYPQVDFQWMKIGTCGYQFILKKGAWESGTEIQRKKLNDTTVQFTLTDGDYNWGVKAIDPVDQTETEFAFRSFAIDITPPAVPVPLSPINNSEVMKGEITFQWQSPDAGQEDISYIVKLYRQNGTQNILVTEQAVTSTDYTYHFTESGTYFWHVRAVDKANNTSPLSALHKLVVLDYNHSLEGKIVTLKAPYNGYESSKPEITFWWDTVEDAELYLFQLVKPNFSTIEELIREVNLATNQITLQLEPGTYQWHVKAKNANSETPFSGIFSVTVKEAD